MNHESELDRRQRRTKIAFREAFAELVSEKEVSKITVKEIAERADRDRKTFYLHYNSVEDLVDEVLNDEMKRIADTIGKVSFGKDGHIDVVGLFNVMSAELVSSFNERATVMRHVDTDRMISRLRPILTKAIVEEDSLGLAKTLGPYLDLFVAYFCAGLLALYHQWVTSESEVPMKQLAELAGAATAGGMAALTDAARRKKIS